MGKFLLAAAALLFSLQALFAGEAQAAKREDVRKVIELMYERPVNGAILSRTFQDGDAQVVFVSKGLRYTIYYTGPRDPRLQFLSFWVRPNGTAKKKDVRTFTDHGLDGVVDFGLNGKNGDERARQLFESGYDSAHHKRSGEQFAAHWQKQYDLAIAAALRTLPKASPKFKKGGGR